MNALQEEITQKTLGLCVETSKMTAQLLQQAMKKVLADMEKHKKNPQLVRMVKAVHMDNKELTAFLRAYASGMISLPEGMMEMEAAADSDMMEGTDDEE